MKALVKIFTSFLYILRPLLFSGPPGIRILMYHRVEPNDDPKQYDQLNVPPEQFDKQMALLAKHYNVITLEQAINLLKSGVDDAEGKPKIVITFDDGYLDNITHALTILENHQLPAIIFITTQFAEQQLTHPKYKERKEPQHLTWKQVNRLSNHPLISIGSHTNTHPFLSEIEDEQSKTEIVDSKKLIEDHIQKPIQFFCYPSGNYAAREINFLEQSTYRAAVTVKPGSNSIDTPIYELRRTEVTAKDTPIELRKKLAGAYDFLHRFLDFKRERRFERRRRLHMKPSD